MHKISNCDESNWNNIIFFLWCFKVELFGKVKNFFAVKQKDL